MVRAGFFSAVFFIAFSLGASLAHAQAVHGILKVVKGEVHILQATDGKTVDARIGQKVFPKDVITTGPDSRAKVVMIDNNEINISPDTKFEIKSYEYKPEDDKKNVLLDVMYGKVRAKVNQHYEGDNKFQVKTPGAVAGVRGTDFMTSYDPATQASNIVTFSGKVAFGQPGIGGQINNAVMVGAGQTSGANHGATPSTPSMVPKTQLASMDNDSDASKDHHGEHGDSRQPAGKNGNGNGSSNNNSSGSNSSANSGTASGANANVNASMAANNTGSTTPPPPSTAAGVNAPTAAEPPMPASMGGPALPPPPTMTTGADFAPPPPPPVLIPTVATGPTVFVPPVNPCGAGSACAPHGLFNVHVSVSGGSTPP